MDVSENSISTSKNISIISDILIKPPLRNASEYNFSLDFKKTNEESDSCSIVSPSISDDSVKDPWYFPSDDNYYSESLPEKRKCLKTDYFPSSVVKPEISNLIYVSNFYIF